MTLEDAVKEGILAYYNQKPDGVGVQVTMADFIVDAIRKHFTIASL